MKRYNDIKKLISLNDLAINRAKENLEIYQANREEHLHYKSLLENDRMAINSVSELLRLYKVQGKILQRELSKYRLWPMKVLVEKHNDKKVYKVECWNCGSILEYTHNDIEIDERDGNYVTCPICDSFINHSDDRLVSKVNK